MKLVKSNKILNTDKHDIFARTIGNKLAPARKIAILSHVNPDGDAVGSSLALSHFLSNDGIDSIVIMPNEYPDYLKWMPGSEDVIIYSKKKKLAEEIVMEAEILFMLDFNSTERAGKLGPSIKETGAFKIMIDHHPDPDGFADAILTDTISSSTAELVYRYMEKTGKASCIDSRVAECIYAGIMSDTGSFSYNSSEPETYRVLSELLKRGIDKDAIYSRVYDNFSENRMRLLGFCLDKKMVVLPEYGTAYISLSLDEKKKYRFVRGDAEGFVNYPLSIKGIDFAVFFMENDDHIKLSFRSRGSFDTNIFAVENFGGGGHLNASGGESELGLLDTINKFVSVLPKYKERRKAEG